MGATYLQQVPPEQHAPPLQQGIVQHEACTDVAECAAALWAEAVQHGASQQATLQQAVLHLAGSQQACLVGAAKATEAHTNVRASPTRMFLIIEILQFGMSE